MCWSENSQVFSTIDRNSSMLATKHVRMRAMIVYAIARHTLQNYVWRKFCFQIFLTIAPGKKKKHTNDRYSNESIRLECLYIHSIVPLCGEFIARRKSGYVTIVRHVKLPWKVVEECVLALIIPCHRSDGAFLLHGRRCSRHCRLPSMYLIIFKVIRDIFRYLIPGDRVKLKDALLRVSAQVWQEFIISINIVFKYMKYVYRDINWWEDGRRCCLEM